MTPNERMTKKKPKKKPTHS
uniref:Uncharacterized protein n=1 Tax=Anguilla anguilla TaxID=7936 RepID=A0A0E9UJW5_ANGAN